LGEITRRIAGGTHRADNCLVALLKTFRNENELQRAGAPRPAYFGTYLCSVVADAVQSDRAHLMAENYFYTSSGARR
jgi:hypothetical protein